MVTRRLRELEQILGVRLFERTSRGVTPTEFGAAFVEHGRAVLAQISQAARHLDEVTIVALSSEATVSAKALALAEHMAGHRRFYRALYTSPCGFALSKALNRLFLPANRQVVRDTCGRQLDERTTEDIASFLTEGWGDFVRAWVVEDPDPLDPHEFTSRLLHIASVVLPRGRQTSATFKRADDDN